MIGPYIKWLSRESTDRQTNRLTGPILYPGPLMREGNIQFFERRSINRNIEVKISILLELIAFYIAGLKKYVTRMELRKM